MITEIALIIIIWLCGVISLMIVYNSRIEKSSKLIDVKKIAFEKRKKNTSKEIRLIQKSIKHQAKLGYQALQWEYSNKNVNNNEIKSFFNQEGFDAKYHVIGWANVVGLDISWEDKND